MYNFTLIGVTLIGIFWLIFGILSETEDYPFLGSILIIGIPLFLIWGSVSIHWNNPLFGWFAALYYTYIYENFETEKSLKATIWFLTLVSYLNASLLTLAFINRI